MGRQPRPTLEVANQIANSIQAGGSTKIAAEAAGVPHQVFLQWMERGQKPRARGPYRAFAEAIRKATARAELQAAIDGGKRRPRAGPSHRPEQPAEDPPRECGVAKPAHGTKEANTNSLLLSAEFQQIVSVLSEALAPYPEARTAVQRALKEMEDGPSTDRSAR